MWHVKNDESALETTCGLQCKQSQYELDVAPVGLQPTTNLSGMLNPVKLGMKPVQGEGEGDIKDGVLHDKVRVR